MSDGIRSGVNWMRLKASDSDLRQRGDHQRLGQAGHAFQDAVAAAEQRDEQLLDDLVLADDDAAELALDVVEAVAQLADRFEVVLSEVVGGRDRRNVGRGLIVGPARFGD